MSEPIYNENDTPLDKLRYRKYQKEQGNDCVEKTEPTIIDTILGFKWYCVPVGWPEVDLDNLEDRVCKKLTPLLYPELLLFDKEVFGPYNTEEECKGNCEERWFCKDTVECELQNRLDENGIAKPNGYKTREECENSCNKRWFCINNNCQFIDQDDEAVQDLPEGSGPFDTQTICLGHCDHRWFCIIEDGIQHCVLVRLGGVWTAENGWTTAEDCEENCTEPPPTPSLSA